MERVEMVSPGEFLWVVNEYGNLKMIIVESIYWDTEPDLEGWNIIYKGEEYYLECCYKLSAPMLSN